jgi:Ni,Fe-hydrogenase III large subunit
MFQYGPATGGLIESVGMNIETFGEQIQAISVVPYKTRRISVSVPIEDLLLNIERINGNFTASHVAAFLTAVENAYCVTPPREVILGRVAQIELERIRNHLMTTQRLTEHAGFLVPSAHLLYLVENVNRIIGRAFGHRYFFGVNTLRGFKMDWQLDVNILKTIIDEFQDTFKCILENRVFIDRLQGNGVVTDESSIGPAARAAGYTYDARLDGDLAGVYRELDFNVCKTDLPDAFGRLLIRGREVSESLRILLRILRSVRINSGDSVDWFGDQVNDSKNFTSSGLGRVESPSGDLTYRVDVRDGVISKVHLLSPSEVNLRSFRSSMSGKVFTDLPFNWDSFGIWMAEVGVEFR